MRRIGVPSAAPAIATATALTTSCGGGGAKVEAQVTTTTTTMGQEFMDLDAAYQKASSMKSSTIHPRKRS